MADNWRKLSLKDANVLLIDCDHRTPAAVEAGYPYVTIPQLKNGHINLSLARRICEADFVRWTRKARPTENDVVLSRRTNPGVTAFVPRGVDFALGQNLVLLRADGRRVYPPFLRWLVRGPEWWEQIGKFLNAGAVFDSLKCADVPKFELHIPPISEQRAIADILGTLDDKIELTRRMNETLEEIARALFKSWFVDFDPVRVKADGRKLPSSLDNLFPNESEASEKGKIPKGWGVGTILAKAQLLSGGTPKTDRQDYWDGGVPWASAKDVSQCADTFLISTERTITEKGLEESATQLIPAFSTVVVARGATTGRMVIFGREMAMNQTCYALTSMIKTPFVLYCQLLQGIDGLVHAAHGSVFDTITTSTFNTGRFILAPNGVLETFEKLASPIFDRILTNCEGARTLAALRDTLLPKLISGELRVKDAEKRLEAVV